MLPFLKVPVVLAGNQDQNEPDKTVDSRILPSEISAYQPGYYWGAFIYMKGGHVFCTTLTCEEIEKAVKDYWGEFGRRSNVKLFQ